MYLAAGSRSHVTGFESCLLNLEAEQPESQALCVRTDKCNYENLSYRPILRTHPLIAPIELMESAPIVHVGRQSQESLQTRQVR